MYAISTGSTKNSSYPANLALLANLVLVKFRDDTVLDPRGSEWFSWFSPTGAMEQLNTTELYRQDWIGLRALDQVKGKLLSIDARKCVDETGVVDVEGDADAGGQAGKLHLLEVAGDHLQLGQEDLDMIINTFLKD